MEYNAGMDTTKDLAAANFSKVVTKTKDGLVRTVLVPGSEAKQYLVIIRRDKMLSTECILQTSIGGVPCQGNSKTMCYHSRAALRVAAGNKRVHFCECKTSALRLSHTGGKVVSVTSRQSGKQVYIVVKV